MKISYMQAKHKPLLFYGNSELNDEFLSLNYLLTIYYI